MDILVGEQSFSIDTMIVQSSQSIAYLDSEKGKELLETLSMVGEISVRLSYDTGAISIDIMGSDYGQFKLFAKTLIQNNAWNYIVEENGTLEDWNRYITDKCPMN